MYYGNICFFSYIRSHVWSIIGPAWLPWQPDSNDNHFPKVRVMGIMVVYHPRGLAFRKVLKFDVKIWAVDYCTPLRYHDLSIILWEEKTILLDFIFHKLLEL